MSTIADVVEQLKTTNEKTITKEDLSIGVESITASLSAGFDRLDKSVSSGIGLKGSRLSIPGLDSLISLLTDNFFTRFVSNIKNTVTNAIMAPIVAITNTVSNIKTALLDSVKTIGSFIMKPFSALSGFISSFFRRKNPELASIQQTVENISNRLDSIDKSLIDYLKSSERGRLDQLEQNRESNRAEERSRRSRPDISRGRRDRSGPGFLEGILAGEFLSLITGTFGRMFAVIGAGAGVAIAAEIFGFDDWIKALRLPNLIEGTKNTFSGIASTFARIKDIKLPNLGFISSGITSLFTRISDTVSNIKLPTLNLGISSLFSRISDTVSNIKLPSISSAFSGVTDIKLPSISSAFSGVTDVFKRISNVSISPVRNFISGFLDFIKPLTGMLGKLLTPLKGIVKFLRFNPITGVLLSLFDFVKGFFSGFTGTQGSLTEKLTAGIEEGFLGIIKGFTEAFDLILFKIPGWIADKLGLDWISETLKGFSLTDSVDPVYEGIKLLFTNTSDVFSLISDFVSLQLKRVTDTVEESFFGILKTIKNIPDQIYLLAAENLRFSMPDISIPVPKFLGGGEIKVIEGFSVGVGSKVAVAAAQGRIQAREQAFIQRVETNRTETGIILERMAATREDLRIAAQGPAIAPTVQTNIDGRTNQNSTTVLNQPVMPSTVDPYDLAAGPI